MSHELVLNTTKGSHTVAISDNVEKLTEINKFLTELIDTMEKISGGCTSDGYDNADFDKFVCICGVLDHSYELILLTNENKHKIETWLYVIDSELFEDKTEELFGVKLGFVRQTKCDDPIFPVEWTTAIIRPCKISMIE